MPTRDLKETRLVSKLWENEANLILRKRTKFSYIAYHKSNLISPFPSVNVKLLPAISVGYSPCHQIEDMRGKDPSFRQGFVEFALKNGEHIEQFYFHMADVFYSAMTVLLGGIEFQKLTRLEIRICKTDDPQFPFSEVPGQFNMPNLKQFRIVNNIYVKSHMGYQAMACGILKQAGKLERLNIFDVGTIFFPDLSGCRRLVYFRWDFNPFKARRTYRDPW